MITNSIVMLKMPSIAQKLNSEASVIGYLSIEELDLGAKYLVVSLTRREGRFGRQLEAVILYAPQNKRKVSLPARLTTILTDEEIENYREGEIENS